MPKSSLEPPVTPHSGEHYHRELLEVPWGGRITTVEAGSSMSQVRVLLLFLILTPDLPAYLILPFLVGHTLVDLYSLLDKE